MKDTPLTVKVEDEQLVIRIGIGTLAFCANESDIFQPLVYGDDDEKSGWFPAYKVSDETLFAKEIKLQLLDEAEDGSNAVTRLLDRAIVDALEDGGDGINPTDKQGNILEW